LKAVDGASQLLGEKGKSYSADKAGETAGPSLCVGGDGAGVVHQASRSSDEPPGWGGHGTVGTNRCSREPCLNSVSGELLPKMPPLLLELWDWMYWWAGSPEMTSCAPAGTHTAGGGTRCGSDRCSRASLWGVNLIPGFVNPAEPFLAGLGRARRACARRPALGLRQPLTFSAFIVGGEKPSSPWCWVRPVTGGSA